MPLKLMLCLVLFCFALPVVANNVISDQPVADAASTATDDNGDDPASGAAAAKTGAAAANGQDKVPIRRTNGETTVRPPRWHSFLPGMFR